MGVCVCPRDTLCFVQLWRFTLLLMITSLGYETFIFSIADEKKEHKSLSALDKKPRVFLFLTFVFSKHTNWGGRKRRKKISNFCPVVSFIAVVIPFVCLIHHFHHIRIHRIV